MLNRAQVPTNPPPNSLSPFRGVSRIDHMPVGMIAQEPSHKKRQERSLAVLGRSVRDEPVKKAAVNFLKRLNNRLDMRRELHLGPLQQAVGVQFPTRPL